MKHVTLLISALHRIRHWNRFNSFILYFICHIVSLWSPSILIFEVKGELSLSFSDQHAMKGILRSGGTVARIFHFGNGILFAQKHTVFQIKCTSVIKITCYLFSSYLLRSHNNLPSISYKSISSYNRRNQV